MLGWVVSAVPHGVMVLLVSLAVQELFFNSIVLSQVYSCVLCFSKRLVVVAVLISFVLLLIGFRGFYGTLGFLMTSRSILPSGIVPFIGQLSLYCFCCNSLFGGAACIKVPVGVDLFWCRPSGMCCEFLILFTFLLVFVCSMTLFVYHVTSELSQSSISCDWLVFQLFHCFRVLSLVAFNVLCTTVYLFVTLFSFLLVESCCFSFMCLVLCFRFCSGFCLLRFFLCPLSVSFSSLVFPFSVVFYCSVGVLHWYCVCCSFVWRLVFIGFFGFPLLSVFVPIF